jgi:hypothetical protein
VINDTNDYLRGQADCRDGKEHQAGKSESYDDGYASWYAWEQCLTNQTSQPRFTHRGRADG